MCICHRFIKIQYNILDKHVNEYAYSMNIHGSMSTVKPNLVAPMMHHD